MKPDNKPTRIGGSNKLVSMKEAAGQLGMSYYWLKDNYRAQGIPFVTVGRLIKFRERDLAAWLESRRRM